MKKTFTLVTVCLITLSVTAQKGQWYAGGQVGFSTNQNKTVSGGNSTDTYKNTSWSFSPEIGTFITNNLQVGAGISFSGSKSKDQINTGYTSESNFTGAMLYSRYFWGKEAFKPFAGVSLRYSAGKSENRNGITITESKQTNFNAAINAGFSYALSKRVTALGSFGFLGYSSSVSTSSSSSDKFKNSSFGFDASSLGDRFDIGFYYTLHK